ncbi:unnamed protein product [Heligmosomoides polygyrus]|uniref:Secreted protein n=1 Tax=Heligmosomoides polygyrus TaxID=6339 RepID=A0A183G422_HELPZ|nr:unnamed protein product [Heligmosomoides polygyrus]
MFALQREHPTTVIFQIFFRSMHKCIPALSIFEIAHSESPFLSVSMNHPPKQTRIQAAFMIVHFKRLEIRVHRR